MATLTLELPQKNKKQILDLLSQFDFIKINKKTKFKQNLENELKQSFKEMKMIENGEINGITMNELFKELESVK